MLSGLKKIFHFFFYHFRHFTAFHCCRIHKIERCSVALPGDHRLDHVPRGERGPAWQATADSLNRASSSSFSSRCQYRVRSGSGRSGCPGVVPQLPDLRRRHERGPQQPHLGQPGQPPRVQLVRFRPAGQVPGLGGVDQLHRQPGRLQHRRTRCASSREVDSSVTFSIRSPPAGQPAPGSRRASLHRPHPAAPPARPGRVRHPGAHHPGAFATSTAATRSRICSCSSSSITCGSLTAAISSCQTEYTAGCPGVPVGDRRI